MPTWTQARIEEAVALSKKGFSFGDIAKRLGSSRGAVSIRINTALGVKRVRPKSAADGRNKPDATTPTVNFIHNNSESDIVQAEDRVKFVDLTTNACRWPMGGHPGDDPDFGFCGKPQFRGLPGHYGTHYCLEHYRRSLGPKPLKSFDEALEKAGGARPPK